MINMVNDQWDILYIYKAGIVGDGLCGRIVFYIFGSGWGPFRRFNLEKNVKNVFIIMHHIGTGIINITD